MRVTKVSVGMLVLPTVLLESVVSVLLWSVFVMRVLVGILVLSTVLLVSVVSVCVVVVVGIRNL